MPEAAIRSQSARPTAPEAPITTALLTGRPTKRKDRRITSCSCRQQSPGFEPMMSRLTPHPVGPGQESVWDYPRPPRLENVARRLRVVFGGETIADTMSGWRVLETSHPPVYYLPRRDI